LLASLSLTWVSARAAGFTAFGLLTASVALGLVLSSPVRSERWPRFATTELHRFVTLLTLVFIAVHVLVVLLDRFIGFSVTEVVVPFVSHYRPLWMGLGIVSAYLAAALWATDWLQHRIGYRWWRRLHYGTFAVYLGATAHGLGSGSDTSWAWSRAIYLLSLALVGGLLVVRVPSRKRAARPASPAAPSGAAAPPAGAAATTPAAAPMPAAAVAAGAPVTAYPPPPAPDSTTPGAMATAAGAPGGGPAESVGGPPGFSARIRGRLWQGADSGGGSLVVLEGVLDAGFDGHFQVRVHGRTSPGSSRLEVTDNRVWMRGRDGTVWWGRIGAFDGTRLHGTIAGDRPGARTLALAIELFEVTGESVSGAMHAASAGPAASPLAS
jgi:Ferric reductase like transmembrane component